MYIGLTIFNRYEVVEFALDIKYKQITTLETGAIPKVVICIGSWFSGEMICQKIL